MRRTDFSELHLLMLLLKLPRDLVVTHPDSVVKEEEADHVVDKGLALRMIASNTKRLDEEEDKMR